MVKQKLQCGTFSFLCSAPNTKWYLSNYHENYEVEHKSNYHEYEFQAHKVKNLGRLKCRADEMT